MAKIFDPSGDNPFDLFARWMTEAEAAEPNNHNAMALATVGRDGIPSNRMVLLKEFGADGFTFFTNSQSQKGQELEGNPHVALCLYWKTLGRQVRIVGKAEKTSRATTESYFHGRPRGSQIASLCSDQSRPLPDKQIYLDRIAERQEQYGEQTPVPCPDHWNGYCVAPSSIEFWQEGEFRTHDRFVFEMADAGGQWTVTRLYP